MDKLKKIEAFEYLLFKLDEWHTVQNKNGRQNDLSILKSLKLLFFISAVGTKKDSESTLLDEVFDNFVAMPYGHVEIDVYSSIKSNLLRNASIDNSKTLILESFNVANVDIDVRIKIDTSIQNLKNINSGLINMNAFDLVELSHSWYSWKYFFAKAKKNSTLKEYIPSEIIKAEEKIYFLN